MEEKENTVQNPETEEKQPSEFRQFLKTFRNKLALSTNGMAIGLFGTLIIGTIIGQLASIPNLEVIATWATAIKSLMGAGIGLGVALALHYKGVAVVAAMAAGAIGNYAYSFFDMELTQISDPLSCYVSAVVCLLAIHFIMRKKTPVDLILIPLVGLIFSILYSLFLAYFVHYVTLGIGKLIEISFNAIPIIMCMVVSLLMGMALTAPISSVAICVAIQIGNVPLAAAAALIGCCTQMVGFAVETAYDNRWGSVLAVGIGTSMLQFKNIVRKPLIWLPTMISSIILGPFALVFHFATDSVGAGMGTSGLVGLLNTFAVMEYNWLSIILVLLFCVIIPAVLVFFIDFLFRKLGWIKKGDFALQSDL